VGRGQGEPPLRARFNKGQRHREHGDHGPEPVIPATRRVGSPSDTPAPLSPSTDGSRMRGGRDAGPPPEYRPAGEPGTAWIVVVEDAANQLARGVEPGDRLPVPPEDACLGVDPQAAEGEGDAAGDGKGYERRGVD